MNGSNFDRLDALIALTAKECIDRKAEEYLQEEITVQPDPEFKKRMARVFQVQQPKPRRITWRKALKYALVAILVALSVMFTACMSISQIRQAIWNAVVEWYDDYISVRFEPTGAVIPSDGTTTPTPDVSDSVPPENSATTPTEPPQKIEQVNAPTYVPYGYMVMSQASRNSFYQEYYDADGDFAYVFMQKPLGTSVDVDGTGAQGNMIQINGVDALLVYDENNQISLVWRDNLYSYSLQGVFDSEEEAIRIAESVVVLK